MIYVAHVGYFILILSLRVYESGDVLLHLFLPMLTKLRLPGPYPAKSGRRANRQVVRSMGISFQVMDWEITSARPLPMLQAGGHRSLRFQRER